MLEGKKVGVSEALKLGMVDAVADSPDEMMMQAKAWIAANLMPFAPGMKLTVRWEKLSVKAFQGARNQRSEPAGATFSGPNGYADGK